MDREALRRYARARLHVARHVPLEADEAHGRRAYLETLLRHLDHHEAPIDAADSARSQALQDEPEVGACIEREHLDVLDALCGF